MIAAGVAELGPLRSLISGAIDDRGELQDDASTELASIRRELTISHDRLQQRMHALLRSRAIRGALQDHIITLRDGRYVVPVRSEARSLVPGVVHDTSASGATIYVEPLAVVDLGNRWRELQIQERHEVERILRELSEAVGEAEPELRDAVERLAHLDLAFAKGAFAVELGATALAVPGTTQPWIAEPPATLQLENARHPLLEGDVVPVTIEVGGDTLALLITGPNTGGKTVALKMAGLLCLMALAGLPIPADPGTRVPVYTSIFADIGDEQSIEQSLSTFSGHLTAIIDILERAGSQSLVLLDELGAGTDPAEGASLAIAIVDRLVQAGVTLIATTHHSELKLYAHQTAGVQNASVEFDVETLSPTYRLTIGLPGQSNALAIAARLGMPSAIIDAATAGLSHAQRDLESVLGDLRKQLQVAERRLEEASEARDAAVALRGDLEQQLAELASEGEQLREEARGRVREEVRELERLIERTRRDVETARMEQAASDLERVREAAEAIAPPPADDAAVPAATVSTLDVEAGSTVWLRGIATAGEALARPDVDGEFEVQFGALRTRVRLQQVVEVAPPGVTPAARTSMPPVPLDVPDEIEVRGQTIDEALPTVEAYLDRAARAGRARVRLIHGKGTGRLRGAVRDLLAEHPLVESFETGSAQEGGEGVTIAHLAATR